MARYRLLSKNELQELEKEFVEFLVLNGIVAEDWLKLKEQDIEKAEKMVELFSDVVLEGVLRKVQYLEYRDKTEIRCFQCLPDKIVLVGLSGDETSDFTDSEYLKEALKNPPKGIRVYTSEKEYKTSREQELFEMTEAGCYISDGKLFKSLCLALK